MNKITIAMVDDELTARNTVKKLLEKDPLYELSADFSSGKALLEWLRKNDVDILICDMQMAEMNGVEIIRSIHIINEYLPVIVISGFDNFDYVRGSLINGAAHYLLKNELTREKLLDVLNQVRERYRIVPEGHSIVRKVGYCMTDQREFSGGHIREMVRSGILDFDIFNVVPLAIGPDFKGVEKGNGAEYKQDICKAVLDMLNQFLAGKYKYLVLQTREMHLLVLISFSKECSTLLMLNSVNNLLNRLHRQVIRMLDITVTSVVGNVHREVESAVAETEALDAILQDKFYLGGNRKCAISIHKKMHYAEEEISENFWKQLHFELENKGEQCIQVLQDIFEVMEKEKMHPDLVRESCRTILEEMVRCALVGREEAGVLQERLKEMETFEEYRTEILALYNNKRLTEKKKEQPCSELVERAILYIQKNYGEDVSLEACAAGLGCSYTYLSKEFKRETGMRFVEYLNHRRITQAKSLLLRNACSMKEITALCGFNNYNYFFRVFKELEGMTPREFLEQGRGEEAT